VAEKSASKQSASARGANSAARKAAPTVEATKKSAFKVARKSLAHQSPKRKAASQKVAGKKEASKKAAPSPARLAAAGNREGSHVAPSKPSAFVTGSNLKSYLKPSASPSWNRAPSAATIAAVGFRVPRPTRRSPRKVAKAARPGLMVDRGALPQTVKDYGDALIIELDRLVVPTVLKRVREGVALPPPRELAKRMLAVAPARVLANQMAEQIGPEFYDTTGVMVVLAQPGADPISKQAVEQRRKRRTLLALQTSDSRWIYPIWQFVDHDVMPGLAEVVGVFGDHSMWSIGTWLTTPSVEFDGQSAAEWLAERRDWDHLIRVAKHTAQRWAS
jgi:hypothetical protein